MGRIGARGWRLAAAASLVAASPAALGSVASAGCLSTLHVTPRTVPAGAVVTLHGQNYYGATGNPVSDIFLRLDARDGPTIATISPRYSLDGWTIVIPLSTSPGTHTLVATQHGADGRLLSCLPGRATVEVRAPRAAGQGALAVPGAPPTDQPGKGHSWGAVPTPAAVPPALVLALFGLALALRKRGPVNLPGPVGSAARTG